MGFERPSSVFPKDEEEEEEDLAAGFEEVEKILAYEFNDKKLLTAAFTHSSFYYPEERLNECNNSLALLGDSTLNSLITTELFSRYHENLNPGELTKLRAANVDNDKLARIAVKYGLYNFLRHKHRQLHHQIQIFKEEILKYPTQAVGLIEIPKVLADIVEATIGAVYVDSSFSNDTVWKVFKKLLEPLTTPETFQLHPKTELYEFCQKHKLILKTSKSATDNLSTVDVSVDGELIATASYCLRKDIVENRAAKKALDHLKTHWVGGVGTDIEKENAQTNIL